MKSKKERVLILISLLLHVGLTFLHYKMVVGRNLDVDRFYNTALNASSWFETFGFGTKSISFLSYPFVKLGCNQFSIFVLWSLISFWGFLVFIKLLDINKLKKYLQYIAILVFLLPSLHYWTVFYGKEALVFPLMMFLIYVVKERQYRNPLAYLSLLSLLLIRPYLFFLIMGGFLLAFLTEKKVKLKIKLIVLLSTIITALFSTPLLLSFLKITSLKSLSVNYQKIITYASNSGESSIDLLNSNYLDRLFLVLFRPLFYDAKTLYQYWISIEDLLIFLVLVFIMYKIRKVSLFKANLVTKFSIFTGSFIVLFFGIYMYNLGLASRMRVMFLPYLMFGLLQILSKVQKS